MKKDYFIFDMDGVIVDSEPAHRKILNTVFDELGLNFSNEYHQTLVGMAAVPMWKKIKKDYGIHTNANELVNFHREIILFEMEKIDVQPVPGVLQFLQQLKSQNFHISLASSSTRKLISLFMDKFEIATYFDYLVSGDDVERSKPNPDIFLKVAEKYNISPNNFIVVEDSYNGVTAAKAAGMMCVGYVNSNSGNQDLSAADMIINDFAELNIDKIKELTT
ncbi:HAD family hydrolase [Joostella sp. CR20]|uniref:HAD family hydrolase n=1 Tax=Joostella sp. CR20 TaxID=2804312 RepID=UPI00313BC3A1